MQRILIFIIILVLSSSCSRKDLTRDSFSVAQVPASPDQMHATLELRNGWQVRLIGIQSTAAVIRFLEQEVKNKQVRFRFDSQRPQKTHPERSADRSFYAYVILKDGRCLNSVLLQKKLSPVLVDYHLQDSSKSYTNYTPKEENVAPNPNRKRKAALLSGCEKELAEIVEACDYLNPTTRDFAVNIAGNSPGSFNLGQVCELFKESFQKWRYVNDPTGSEYYAKASESISRANLSGDCDDFAVLMYSAVMAIGGEARLTFAWGPKGGHAYAEVKIVGLDKKELFKIIRKHFPAYRIETLHHRDGWLNLDWWAQHPGGPYFQEEHSYVFYPDQDKCNEY